MFTLEFYRASDAEESDPDPMHVIESDNTDDLFTRLESVMGGELSFSYIDVDDGNIRYNVHDLSGDPDEPENIGVAIVVYP